VRYCRIQEVNESWKFSCWPIANCYSTLLGNIGISRSFTHSWLITGFITIVTRRVSLVERELLPLPEHLNSSPVFSGVGVTRSLVFCVMFCRSLLVLLYFFFWSLCCLSFDLRILITSLWYLVAIVLSFLRFTDSDYLPLVSFGHCVVCPSIYGFWLPPFGILWPLCCLSFDLRILITSLWYLLVIVLSFLRFTDSDYLPLVSCGHCVVCPSIYGFWLPLWYLQTLLILLTSTFDQSRYFFVLLHFWNIILYLYFSAFECFEKELPNLQLGSLKTIYMKYHY
jgi:hypothetical protein